MFRFFSLIALFAFLQAGLAFAQEGSSLNWDIDSIFDESAQNTQNASDTNSSDNPSGNQSGDASGSPSGVEPSAAREETNQTQSAQGETGQTQSIQSLVKPRGFTFDASWQFWAGIAPGWNEAPWFDVDGKAFSWGPSAKMRANFSLDAQISEVFRTKTEVYFEVPAFKFSLGDFFFDYNLFNYVFVRAGKYSQSWGISPNFSFTNLLSRVPVDGPSNEAFLFKADVPVGIGGFQFLAQTRADLLGGEEPGISDIGYGGKFNLALRWADFDLGAFYQDDMPLRGFFSVKVTVGKTELYNEWLGVYQDTPRDFSGAVNLGFARDFFDSRLTVNGEAFYNAEKNAYWYRPETNIKDAEISSYLDGLNLALNLVYRFDAKANPRLFIQTLYAQKDKSAQIVPGLRLNLLPHIELYFAVPMALGPRSGYYYTNTPDPDNRPFCVVLLLSLKGNVSASYYK